MSQPISVQDNNYQLFTIHYQLITLQRYKIEKRKSSLLGYILKKMQS